MKKFVVLCTIFCIFLGCTSSESVQKPADSTVSHLISIPEPGGLVFIGVSGPQLKPEQEIEAAREDAARKVSMYHGLNASFASVQSMGTNALDYYSDSNFQMDYDNALDRYMESLSYDPKRDVTYGNGSVFVRFSYPGIFPGDINYSFANNVDGSPEWIKRPPLEINGFMAQTGFARRQQRIKDTIARASEDAIAGLISRSSARIRTNESANDNQNSSVVVQRSRGRLLYFMVLETWIDPKDMSVWILAVAKDTN